jgi:signal transduction histidine kinase
MHDVTGYYFTNVLMMLKAAIVVLSREPAKALNILHSAVNQVQEGIDETRKAIRALKETGRERANALRAISQLARTFQALTDIKIHLEFGNAPQTFGDRLDLTVLRFVQAALTNSFRHGKATWVRIALWLTERELLITVSDNGVGAQNIVKGMGLSGMERRLCPVRGQVAARNLPGGFQVSARIPRQSEVESVV